MKQRRSQRVDLVGFIRSQLSGLQGIPTLCYELIQNADDVKDEAGQPGATRIAFDVCDDALWVENDGVFREVDFDRMERLSWGDKRNEAGTTGAFGIGFTAVYQVTDAPEIFSSGEHWTFRPLAAENLDVQACATQFTRLRLPWAFEMSPIRQQLGMAPVRCEELDVFTAQIGEAIRSAALFLKQITVLELRRAGTLVHRIEVSREGSHLLVQENGSVTAWLLLPGSFDDAPIRRQYGELIEEKRKPLVQLAIPEQPLEDGLLYAFLPSETRTGLPFHINADFYPSSDRKRIVFEGGHRQEWNRLAIRCAEETLAAGVDALLALFTPTAFWAAARRVKDAAGKAGSEFGGFWSRLGPLVRSLPTALTLAEERCRPDAALFLDRDKQVSAAPVFESIGLPVVHPSLRLYRNLLLETGAQTPRALDIAGAFGRRGWTRRTPPAEMPAALRTEEQWAVFLSAVEEIFAATPHQETNAARVALAQCALAFGSDGALWPPRELFAADEKTRALFGGLADTVWLAAGQSEWIMGLAPRFGLADGVRLLESAHAVLEEQWRQGRFDLQKLYEWLESGREEIAADAQMRERLKACPIWPAANQTLRPVTDRFLPGDFKDPLGLTQLIDLAALGGRREFLERTLQVRELNLLTYVSELVPPAVEAGGLSRARRLDLLKLLAENSGKLQGHPQLRSRLARLPLVWCGDKGFLPAQRAYMHSQVVYRLLGDKHPYAKAVPGVAADALKSLYEWLGVAAQPRPEHLLDRIRELVAAPATTGAAAEIETLFEYIAGSREAWDGETPAPFAELKTLAWLPASRNQAQWFAPHEVNSTFSRYLFESQGNFLPFKPLVQQRASRFLAYLKIESEPAPLQVVNHLLYASAHGQPVSQEIYRRLNELRDRLGHTLVQRLKEAACLYLKLPDGQLQYVKPSFVFWDEHPFGRRRYRLTPEFGAYRDLLDKLGVKARPDTQDAIAVLHEIAAEFGPGNRPLDDDLEGESTVMECWRLLSAALLAQQIAGSDIRRQLHDTKSILAARRLLERPGTLFFDDRPSWGAKFQQLENNLIKPVEGAWQAMQAAGVRGLSEVVETRLSECANQSPDSLIAQRLRERGNLLRRVAEAYGEKAPGGFDLQRLEQLNFIRGETIEVVRTFKGFARPDSVPELVDAIRVEQTIYFRAVDGCYPWLDIASELSYVIYPSGELNSLGLEVREILSAASAQEASAVLDRLGYPRLPESFTPAPVASPAVLPGGGPAPAEAEGNAGAGVALPKPSEQEAQPPAPRTQPGTGRTAPSEHPAGTSGGASGGTSGPGANAQPGHGESGQRNGSQPAAPRPAENRSTSRLISYVSPGDRPAAEQDGAAPAWNRDETGRRGVARVMAFEREQGRTPTDMETVQHNHPGYDVKSIDADGQVRYIEVKALTGTWSSSAPAQLTKNEFKDALKKGEDYWLYLVEQLGAEGEQLHLIRNPAQRADFFLFDHGWLAVAEPVPAAEPGVHTPHAI